MSIFWGKWRWCGFFCRTNWWQIPALFLFSSLAHDDVPCICDICASIVGYAPANEKYAVDLFGDCLALFAFAPKHELLVRKELSLLLIEAVIRFYFCFIDHNTETRTVGYTPGGPCSNRQLLGYHVVRHHLSGLLVAVY